MYELDLKDRIISSITNGIPELIEEKFDKINYFSKQELLNKNNLSSNMKVLVKKLI